MTILALFDAVRGAEFFPMAPLLSIEHTCSSAKRTGPVQGGQNCRTDKLRTVGNAFQCLDQGVIRLERDDMSLAVHTHSSVTNYYLN